MAAANTSGSETNTLHLAEILSDLVSLQLSDPKAALALVSARSPTPAPKTNESGNGDEEDADADIKRAKDLLKFHREIKEAGVRGDLGRVLEEARVSVERAGVW